METPTMADIQHVRDHAEKQRARGKNLDLKVLRQARADIKAEANNLLQQAEDNEREPTAKEQARLDTLEAWTTEVQGLIDEEQDKRDEQLRHASRNGTGLGSQTGGGMPAQPHGDGRQPIIRGNESRQFQAMFAGLDTGGFKSMREYLGVIHRGLNDNRLQAATGNSTRGGPDGGYTVPSQFLGNLLNSSLEGEIVRPRADVVPMTENNAWAPVWDTGDHSQNIGGLTGEWLSEGAQRSSVQKVKFRGIELIAQKLAIYTAATNELLEDGFQFDNQLESALVQAIGWYLDLAYLVGNGVGKPRGVLNDPSLVTVAKDSGQSANTIAYANLTKMFARLHPSSMNNAVWVANPTTIPQLMQTFAEGSSGGGERMPILREDGMGNFTMLTRPVYFTEKVPTLGNKGDIMLCDFSKYVIGMRREASLQRSMHVGWENDETHFRLILRTTGQGKWDKAITPKTGDPLSWCVTLAERA
jgi:HK97 family phage major capsid protein